MNDNAYNGDMYNNLSFSGAQDQPNKFKKQLCYPFIYKSIL